MYPFARLAWQMLLANRQPDLPAGGLHESRHICWPWDADIFGEMNNGRVLTTFDLGRIPWGFRCGLARALRRRGWGLTTAGANVQYRKRIVPFRRYDMKSRALGYDERFIYLHQSICVTMSVTPTLSIASQPPARAGWCQSQRCLRKCGSLTGIRPFPNGCSAG